MGVSPNLYQIPTPLVFGIHRTKTPRHLEMVTRHHVVHHARGRLFDVDGRVVTGLGQGARQHDMAILNGVGSITAIYTVLTEGDDQQDPIADAARAILDGHIILTRTLADAGHYPAIDIEQSISRAMVNLIKPAHLEQIRHFKQLFSRYQRSRDLISVGAYAAGSDPLLDQAIRLYPAFEGFLQQALSERAGFDSSVDRLFALFGAHR